MEMIELIWNAPVSESKIALQIAALALCEGQQVLDVGCGCGEVLLRICEAHAVAATGIDSSSEHIAEARRRTDDRNLKGNARFLEADAQSWNVESASFDVVICLGASHAFGLGSKAYINALHRILPMVRPGGQILISEAYAKQSIPEGYREFIGDSTTDEMTHESNVMSGKSLGLIPLGAWTSSEDEWDEFEWNYQRVVEQRADHPQASDTDISKRFRRREWIDAYLRWGRDTLGYGTYLFRKPTSVGPLDVSN